MSREGVRGSRGFTLVELAIVLVIIGIILGAVLKGQDLIMNARAKKFVSKVKAWELAQWTFYDRKGRFAGDQDRNGLIGYHPNNDDVKSDLTSANFINPPYEMSGGNPSNTITIGSYKFYVYFGQDCNNNKNVMVLCKTDDCNGPFNTDYLVFLDALDTSIDGVANGTAGNVVCVTNANNPASTAWLFKDYISPASCDTSAKAIVYYFDSGRE